MVVSSNARDGSNDTEDVGEKDGSSLGRAEGVRMSPVGVPETVGLVVGSLDGNSDGFVVVPYVGFELGKADSSKVGLNECSLLGSLDGCCDGLALCSFDNVGLLDGISDVEGCILGAFV